MRPEVPIGDADYTNAKCWRETCTEVDEDARPLAESCKRVAREMLGAGVKAVVTCVDPLQVPAELAGRHWHKRLLAELPSAAQIERRLAPSGVKAARLYERHALLQVIREDLQGSRDLPIVSACVCYSGARSFLGRAPCRPP